MTESEALPKEVFEELRKQYLESITEHLAAIKQAMTHLRQEITEEHLKTLRLLVHKMAGSAGTYGYTKVSTLCAEWEIKVLDMLKQHDAHSLDEFDVFLIKIQKEFKSDE